LARNLLTALEIKASLKSKLRDGDGLWLHFNRSGSRSFVFIYVRQGRRREMGLGTYGTGTGQLSLSAARGKADEIRAILGRGGDPFTDLPERQPRVASLTFGQVALEYIATMSGRWKGEKTKTAWERMVSTYAKSLHKIPVGDITTDDVLRVLRPLWDEKPDTATKVRERLKLVLDHAKARGLRAGDNPAAWKGHLDQLMPPPAKLKDGHLAAVPYTEVPALIARLRDAEGSSAAAMQFIVLTAARSAEARGAQWKEFDTTGKLWTVPAARMKSGREHRVPLSDAATAIVEQERARRRGDLVFAGVSPLRPISDVAVAKALRAAGGGVGTIHGFRSAFRDWAAEETNHQREVAEAALAHSVGDSVERAYRRGDALAKRRLLMDDWGAFCEGAANAST
jgi:integrase